jgi:hypothetical protein
MGMFVERVEVWAAPIADKPGALSMILQGMREAGADLNFIVARRSPDKPGSGVIFITPIRGDREVEAASTLGFNLTNSVDAVCVEGDNKAGVTAELSEMISGLGINVRGLSVAVIGTRFKAYFGFDNPADAEAAVNVLREAGAVLVH